VLLHHSRSEGAGGREHLGREHLGTELGFERGCMSLSIKCICAARHQLCLHRCQLVLCVLFVRVCVCVCVWVWVLIYRDTIQVSMNADTIHALMNADTIHVRVHAHTNAATQE